jgi:lipid II:glycine glycyltransferase (peptidoglycan interpeptide bridge formation enzyme)
MKGKALYSTGASSEDGLKINASKSVQHYAMSMLARDGFKVYEMGEVHPNAKPEDGKVYGLTRFKMSFGGKVVPFRKVICKISEALSGQKK